jgi:uncharacterized RDD family membrane protein YckC
MTAQTAAGHWAPAAPASWEASPPVRFTGVALRTVAFLIDLALLALYWWLLFTTPALRAWNGPVLATLLVAVPVAYFIVGWGRFGGTIGMRVLNLRIVRARDGGRIGYVTSLVRFTAMAATIAAMLFLIGGLLVLPMVIDRRRRAIHDFVSGTVVIRPGWRRSASP